MFATRPRSLYRNFSSALLGRPSSEAPSSGFVVISDEESEEMDSYCWGLCKNNRINRLPFPQDRLLKIVHTADREQEASIFKVWFLPVPDQPLSSNRYYVISARGYHKGRVYACSKDDDFVTTCCYNRVREDPRPKPFDHRDIYQQVEIRRNREGGFYAVPVALDGCPPKFLRKRGWEVHVAHSFKLQLGEALGLRASSQSHAPSLDFPISSRRSSAVVLGKWYCPCVYVKEASAKVKQQMKTSLFYELTLKRWWEQIYSCENEEEGRGSKPVVAVDACVRRLTTSVYGMEAEKEDRYDADGCIYFRAKGGGAVAHREKARVGLSSAVYEKMKCLQEDRGWFDAAEREVRVQGENVVRSRKGWRKFCCYVLVESFILRRRDGILLINFQFRNADRIESKWE